MYAGKDENYLDPAMVEWDRNLLTVMRRQVEGSTDNYIAHAKPEIIRGPPAYAELDFAIDGLSSVSNKYSEVIAGKTWPVLVPEVDHDWQAVFRVAWIK